MLALGCKSQFVLFDAKSFEPIVGIKLPTFDSTMGSSVLSADSYRSEPLAIYIYELFPVWK